MAGGVVLVASVGFTTDFIVRRLSRGGVRRVVAVGLRVEEDPRSWERVEKSFQVLDSFLRTMGIEGELVPVASGGSLLRELTELLLAELRGSACGGDCVVEVFLTGGPRILVVSLALATLLLPDEALRRVVISVYGEQFDAELVIRPWYVAVLRGLDAVERKILEALVRLGGSARPSELLVELGIARSTLYKKLARLRRLGLVHSQDGRIVVSRDVESILV